SFFFLISPLILYYSRYIRHDMPAIFGALIMAVSAWRYIEGRSFRYLIALAIGQAILYASKEVSFIYIAIFGSFLTLYFIARLLDVRWENPLWRRVFAGALIAVLLLGLALGVIQTAQGERSEERRAGKESRSGWPPHHEKRAGAEWRRGANTGRGVGSWR